MHPVGFMGIFVAVLGGGLLVWSLRGSGQTRAQIALAQSWPEATAVVDAADVQMHTRYAGRTVYSFEPKLRYRFQVGGQTHGGDRLRFGYVRTSFERQAHQLMAAYPPGSWIRIRYNPHAPGDNVVELIPGPNQKATSVIGGLLLALGLVLTVAAASGIFPDSRSHHRTHRY